MLKAFTLFSGFPLLRTDKIISCWDNPRTIAHQSWDAWIWTTKTQQWSHSSPLSHWQVNSRQAGFNTILPKIHMAHHFPIFWLPLQYRWGICRFRRRLFQLIEAVIVFVSWETAPEHCIHYQSRLGIYSLFLQSSNTHISLALSHTTKGTKSVSDYAIDTESRETQHSQTITHGNFEKLSCPPQPQQVETARVFCIRMCCTIINLLYDS